MKKLLLTFVFVFILGGAIYSVYNYNKSNSNKNISASNEKGTGNNDVSNITSVGSASPHININTPKIKAMDFKLKDLNGKEISLSDFKGKKVYLNFFATWCPPCKAEMPEMQKLYEETKDSDLVIIAVDLGEDAQTVGNFIIKNKYTFKILLDINNSASEKYQIASIPSSYFIDKDGNIVDKHVGSINIQDMEIYIDKLK